MEQSAIRSHMMYCLFIVLSVCAVPVWAHTQAVVVPLFGNTPPLHPSGTTYSNSIGMQFNELPAGSFTMGSPLDEPGRIMDAGVETQHIVTLSRAFWMQLTEVTNGQWDKLLVEPGLADNPTIQHGAEYPVDNVNWYEALFFANQLSLSESRSQCYTMIDCDRTKPGSGAGIYGWSCKTVSFEAACSGYRLPTEAEWEYASRATSENAYANPVSFDPSDTHTGTGFNGNLHAMGWYWFNKNLVDYGGGRTFVDGTKPVAKKQANFWDLYDMHGNLFEWCQDWYGLYTGDATNPPGPITGTQRVQRGGGVYSNAAWARSAARSSWYPNQRGAGTGFRLVLIAP